MTVNALSFIAFLSLISTGTILHYTLPPGSGHQISGGRHGAGAQIHKFLGMTRHEWGNLHFLIALVFLGLLVIHLAIHWNWLYSTAWGSKINPQPLWRRAITFLILVYITIAFGLPFIK